MKRAAEVVVQALCRQGVNRIFCVPGESYLSVLDSLADNDAINVVTCRHEGGAGFMALADARLTNRPGVVFVSRGPGAMNVSIAVHTAQQDAVPLVVFVGQVERSHKNMDAFQELDYQRVFGSIAKWVVEVSHADRVADTVATAFHMASSGTPGPVVISLPEDMLTDATSSDAIAPFTLPEFSLGDEQLGDIANELRNAERPLILAGGLLKTPCGKKALREVADLFCVPVATAVRHADLLCNNHPGFAGHLAYGAPSELVSGIHEADLILAVGTRLGDVTTQGYTVPAAPTPAQRVIQIWPDASKLGQFRHLAKAYCVDPITFLKGLKRHAPEGPQPRHATWRQRLHETARSLRQWTGPQDAHDGVVFGAVVMAADAALPNDALVTLDSGNFGGWVQRIMRFGGERTLLGASSGAMGYGVPAAVAASLRHPDKTVVCFVGDGGFMMTGNELATGIALGARPIIVISDNGAYGTIRMHQEREFPFRVSATGLVNPDFVAIAEAYGATGIKVQTSDDLPAAFSKALQAEGAVVISVATSLEHVSPSGSITDFRMQEKSSGAAHSMAEEGR